MHAPSAEEARQLPQAHLAKLLVADLTAAAGHLHPENATVFHSGDWRNRTLGLFAAQKYKLRSRGGRGGNPSEEKGAAAVELARAYVPACLPIPGI